MREPVTHRTDDGETFRISLIQSLQEDPTFDGVVHTFHVERQDDGGAGPVDSFQVRVRLAPIFVSILSFDERRRLSHRTLEIVEKLLDRGQREDAAVEVSSDGAVRLGPEVIARQLPLGQSAA